MKKDIGIIKFCRVGGLSSVRQKGYNASMPTFHSPPARRGIYAFVWPYIEMFLLGGDNSSIDAGGNSKFNWLRDKNGNRVECTEDEMGNKYWSHKDDKNGRWYYTTKKKMKYFEYVGELWHHLEVPEKDAILRKGSWVKTSFESYKKALAKEAAKRDKDLKRDGFTYTKDHMEVFIEKV